MTKAGKLQTDLEEEKAMNKCLRDNQSQWQTKVCGLEEKITQKEDVCLSILPFIATILFFLLLSNDLSILTLTTGDQGPSGAAEGPDVLPRGQRETDDLRRRHQGGARRGQDLCPAFRSRSAEVEEEQEEEVRTNHHAACLRQSRDWSIDRKPHRPIVETCF